MWFISSFIVTYVYTYPSGFSNSSSSTNSTPTTCPVSTTVLVIIVVVFFIIGVLGGLTVGALVVYGCFKWKLSHQSRHHLPPSSPPPLAPLYEDIEISTVKCEVNENVAYGVTSQST